MNANLLNITTVPIRIEVNITNGSLAPINDLKQPMINVKTGEGGYEINAEPAKISIDTYAARSSLGYGNYNSADFNKTEADRGIKLAYDGVAKIASEGNQLAKGVSAGQIQIQNKRAGATIQTVMEFLPKENADVTFDKGVLNINYRTKDLNIDWENLKSSSVQFNPGSIEFEISEKPRVEIEYLGDPIYVPASADPNYDPPVYLNTVG